MPSQAPKFNRKPDHRNEPPAVFPEGASPQLRLILACQRDVALNGVGGSRTRAINEAADCATNAINYHYKSLEHLIFAAVTAGVERGRYWAEAIQRKIDETAGETEDSLLKSLYVSSGSMAIASLEELPGCYFAGFYAQIDSFNRRFYQQYWLENEADMPPPLLTLATLVGELYPPEEFISRLKVQGCIIHNILAYIEDEVREGLTAGTMTEEQAVDRVLKELDHVVEFQYQGLTGEKISSQAAIYSGCIRLLVQERREIQKAARLALAKK